jgi:hypothetical protein
MSLISQINGLYILIRKTLKIHFGKILIGKHICDLL